MSRLEFLRGPDWRCDAARESLATPLAQLLRDEAPDTVFAPHPADDHPDHRATLPILVAALADSGVRPDVQLYEVWTPLATFDQVVDITPVFPEKLRALACHVSQLGWFRYDRAIAGLNQYRGVMAGRCDFAEVMQRLDLSRELTGR
jgi:N-acetylglucosamine malate deacetylase 1